MKCIKLIAYILSGLIISLVVGLYAFFIFGLPKVLTSADNISKYEAFLLNKTGLPFSIQGLKIKTTPFFGVEVLLDKIYIKPSSGKEIAYGNNLEYKVNLFNLKGAEFSSDYLYGDIESIKSYIKPSQKENKPFNLSYLPQINIKEAFIKFNDKTIGKIDYIKSVKKRGQIITSLFANIESNYLKSPVIFGKSGEIIYSSKGLNFNDFSVQFDNSKLLLSGDARNISIKGNSLPVKELESAFIYFYKLKNPNKRNFIENFTNFKGNMDVDLTYSQGNLNGICKTHDLGADFSNLNIPVFLPETVFNFANKTINAKTSGLFGGEPVKTDFLLTGLLTKDLTVRGNVYSILTNKFTQKYFPKIMVIGSADASVKYLTHNGKVDVDYTLKIPRGTNISTKYGALDNTDKEKHILMHTVKQGNPMKISEYYYSIFDGGEYKKLISGDGLFEKINGHYRLSNLSAKTSGRVPVTIIRSFLKNYVNGGTFDADVKLNLLEKSLLGTLNLYDVKHANFLYLQNTGANFEKDKVMLSMNGTFYDSPVRANAVAKNDFDNIIVHNIDAHLDSFFVQRGKLTSIPKTFPAASGGKISVPKDIDVTVERGVVKIDRVYGRKFDIRNVEMQGTLKNNIATFVMPKAEYANGVWSAKGKYNIKKYSSDIEFFASDIDSNIVATNFFKLKNQIEGSAFATLHFISKDKLNDIKAKATFAMSDGFLPTIGSQEFIVNSSKKPSKSWIMNKFKDIKICLSKITNIDFSKPNVFYSNLYGSFNIDNEQVKDVKIFSKSDYLSMFIEGNYNIDTEGGDLNIWGRRNKTHAKGIRILKIPINLIYRVVFRPEKTKDMYQSKISLIPDIKTKMGDDVSTFRVSVSGNINSKDSLKIILKDLR